MKNNPQSEKQRNLLGSVVFQLDQCIEAFDVLKEVDSIHRAMLASKSSTILPVDRSLVAPLVGLVRDGFCLRVARLFDKRKDSHALTKYLNDREMGELKKHPIITASINARHGNIAHTGKKYVKSPSVEEILSSNLRDILHNIRSTVIFPLINIEEVPLDFEVSCSEYSC